MIEDVTDRFGPCDKSVKADVNAGRDENGGDHYHEVLNHEPDDMVGIILGRQRAKDIAHGLQKASQRKRRKEPNFVKAKLQDMDSKANGEEHNGQNAENK